MGWRSFIFIPAAFRQISPSLLSLSHDMGKMRDYLPTFTFRNLNVFHMYPHLLLEIYPMMHNLVRLDLNGVRCGLSENGVDPIRHETRLPFDLKLASC
jgi:hypothetical protein